MLLVDDEEDAQPVEDWLEGALPLTGAVYSQAPRPFRRSTITEIAEMLLVNAANGYFFNPAERPEIESWMAGDPAPWTFAETCAVLSIEDLNRARLYIRAYKPALRGRQKRKYEGISTAQVNPAQPADGSLAGDRERSDRPGNPGPEWLLQFYGDLDRAEAGHEEAIAFPNELDREAELRRRLLLAADHSSDRRTPALARVALWALLVASTGPLRPVTRAGVLTASAMGLGARPTATLFRKRDAA